MSFLIIITVSGPHGSGKTTIAKALAQALGLRYISAGELFRKLAKERNMNIVEFTKYAANNPEIDYLIDNSIIEEAKKGNIVVDSQLAYWFLRDMNPISILIYASKEVRIKRIMEREGYSLEGAKREIRIRDKIEKERFKKLYGLEIWKIEFFDFALNTSKLSKEESINLVIDVCKKLMNLRGEIWDG